MEKEKGVNVKKVSVVIPAYNAEGCIGKCLSSILSQTFFDYEVIIVNDGSTDGTLKICENYKKLDERFHVFTIKNGGVSRARNFGVRKASGKYLTFVDSDDLVSANYLEKMVMAAEKYRADLILSDLVLVDFKFPEKRVILSGSNYANKTPLVMTRREFDGKKMELIWKTSLLESGCGKLVNLKLWKDKKILLDERMSLGEDFLANLDYYKYIKNIVFLNEPLYYYNNVDGSDSLSHKYRQDLFSIRMYLIKKLKEHIGDIDRLPKKEKEFYYNYVTAYGMNSLESAINVSGYESNKERLARIREIVDNEVFIDAVGRATYLKYPKWRDLILRKDIKKLSSEKNKKQEGMIGPWKNRLARRAMKFYFCNVRKDRQKGKRIDDELVSVGIKNTLKRELKKRH